MFRHQRTYRRDRLVDNITSKIGDREGHGGRDIFPQGSLAAGEHSQGPDTRMAIEGHLVQL